MLNETDVLERLRNGQKFGLFGYHSECYFQDGKRTGYDKLWKAIRMLNGIEEGKPCKRLADECPSLYVGTFNYNYRQHNWRAR